jgi:uncharacterized BrkB/YihY/UPF0761 family membrane protein
MKNFYQPILAVIVIAATISFLILLLLHVIPPENKDAVMLSLGALLTAFGTVIGYYFGSSKSSADKNEVLKGFNKMP